jgi:hypothetical protein
MLATTAPDTEQLDYDPNERRPVTTLIKHPGKGAKERWQWVDDPRRTETGAERHERLLADDRWVDMYGVAAIIGRSYATVKDIRHEDDAQRKILQSAREQLDTKLAERYQMLELQQLQYPVTHDEYDRIQRELDEIDQQIEDRAARSRKPEITQALFRFREARERVLTAIPRERDSAGQSPLWYVSDFIHWRRRRRMNNIWGDKEETRGRPKGSVTKVR